MFCCIMQFLPRATCKILVLVECMWGDVGYLAYNLLNLWLHNKLSFFLFSFFANLKYFVFVWAHIRFLLCYTFWSIRVNCRWPNQSSILQHDVSQNHLVEQISSSHEWSKSKWMLECWNLWWPYIQVGYYDDWLIFFPVVGAWKQGLLYKDVAWAGTGST